MSSDAEVVQSLEVRLVCIHSGQRPSWTSSAPSQFAFAGLSEPERWWPWGRTAMAHLIDAGASGIPQESQLQTRRSSTSKKPNKTVNSIGVLLYQGGWGELVPLESEPGDHQRGSRQEWDLPGERAAAERQSSEERWESRCALMNTFTGK